MEIEDNLMGIFKVMFQNRNNWKHVTNDQKQKYFFIFNRFLSKKYPYQSQLLNMKSINKSIGLDLWFYFMEGKPYPKWFWSKSQKSEQILSDDDFKILFKKFNLDKKEDLNFLAKNYPSLIEEELKIHKKQISK